MKKTIFVPVTGPVQIMDARGKAWAVDERTNSLTTLDMPEGDQALGLFAPRTTYKKHPETVFQVVTRPDHERQSLDDNALAVVVLYVGKFIETYKKEEAMAVGLGEDGHLALVPDHSKALTLIFDEGCLTGLQLFTAQDRIIHDPSSYEQTSLLCRCIRSVEGHYRIDGASITTTAQGKYQRVWTASSWGTVSCELKSLQGDCKEWDVWALQDHIYIRHIPTGLYVTCSDVSHGRTLMLGTKQTLFDYTEWQASAEQEQRQILSVATSRQTLNVCLDGSSRLILSEFSLAVPEFLMTISKVKPETIKKKWPDVREALREYFYVPGSRITGVTNEWGSYVRERRSEIDEDFWATPLTQRLSAGGKSSKQITIETVPLHTVHLGGATVRGDTIPDRFYYSFATGSYAKTKGVALCPESAQRAIDPKAWYAQRYGAEAVRDSVPCECWDPSLTYYHGVSYDGKSHSGEPLLHFPESLLLPRLCPKLGPGCVEVAARHFIPKGTTFLYGGERTTSNPSDYAYHFPGEDQNPGHQKSEKIEVYVEGSNVSRMINYFRGFGPCQNVEFDTHEIVCEDDQGGYIGRPVIVWKVLKDIEPGELVLGTYSPLYNAHLDRMHEGPDGIKQHYVSAEGARSRGLPPHVAINIFSLLDETYTIVWCVPEQTFYQVKKQKRATNAIDSVYRLDQSIIGVCMESTMPCYNKEGVYLKRGTTVPTVDLDKCVVLLNEWEFDMKDATTWFVKKEVLDKLPTFSLSPPFTLGTF